VPGGEALEERFVPMPHVVIVGDRDSGKTTFLALLYAAQVKSGSDRADDFRFHVAYESLDEISGVFQQLMSGNFPDSAAKEGIRGISFRVGYRTSGFGILSRLRSRGWTPGAPASLHFILLRNLEDEMDRFRKGSSLANATLRDVLESDAIAILVDGRKLDLAGEDRQEGSMGKYDGAVEALLAAMQRSHGRAGRGSIHPIFVFTKFDSVDPEALRAAKVEAEPPEAKKTGLRTAYAEALLDHNLPNTMARVRAREPRGVTFTTPSYYFSWVRTEAAAHGRRERIRLGRSGGGGWEPDYSKDEYLALLQCLSKIAMDAGE
jgi:hypothetical protein